MLMQAMKRILVPVDGSETSDKAVAQAVVIAAAMKASLDLLYVASFTEATDDEAAEISWLPETVTGSVGKKSREILGHAGELIPWYVEAAKHTATGIPAERILDFAASNAVALIVIGARGLGPMAGFLLGSISREVIERAACPVMVVK